MRTAAKKVQKGEGRKDGGSSPVTAPALPSFPDPAPSPLTDGKTPEQGSPTHPGGKKTPRTFPPRRKEKPHRPPRHRHILPDPGHPAPPLPASGRRHAPRAYGLAANPTPQALHPFLLFHGRSVKPGRAVSAPAAHPSGAQRLPGPLTNHSLTGTASEPWRIPAGRRQPRSRQPMTFRQRQAVRGAVVQSVFRFRFEPGSLPFLRAKVVRSASAGQGLLRGDPSGPPLPRRDLKVCGKIHPRFGGASAMLPPLPAAAVISRRKSLTVRRRCTYRHSEIKS